MRLLVIIPSYLKSNNEYNMVYVHTRLKEYVKRGHDVLVFVPSKKQDSYSLDGIKVYKGKVEETYIKYIDQFNPEVIIAHVIKPIIIKTAEFLKHRLNVKIITWIHGYEVMKIYRFNFKLILIPSLHSFKDICKNIFRLTIYDRYKLKLAKSYMQQRIKGNEPIIFVSNWMKAETEKDLKININTSYEIVPNPVGEVFKFVEREEKCLKNILVIRNFNTYKYAPDIINKIVKRLPKEFNITIVGKGICLKRIKKENKLRKNVNIYENFLNHEEIIELHKKHGIFLCPSRLDAQGVSMCEAMATGLVVVTSDIGGIREFVNQEVGVLCNNNDIDKFVNSIISISDKLDDYKQKSLKASQSINDICNFNKIIERELNIIEQNVIDK